jgi:spermidine/putrescine-binding protein
MYTNLLGGEVYDVMIPSDYMIERLIAEGRIQKLDFTKIPNYAGVMDNLKGLDYDPNQEYSAPYFWGNVGLVYNTEVVSEEDLEAGWAVLMNEKYKGRVYFYDSERDAFMIALKALGFSANTAVAAQLEAAYNWLLSFDATMDPVYVTDDVIDNMIGGMKDIAVMYSGDATYVISENESLAYFVPEEGTNLWVDAMVISKDAKNVDLAHKFIDFMLSKDIAYLNTAYVGYTTTIQQVFDEVTGPDGDYEGFDSYVPRTDNPLDEVFRYNENTKKILSDYWTLVKAQ